MSYRLTNEAAADIEGILLNGLNAFGTELALSYHEKLFKLFELIADFPEMSRERLELSVPCRIHPFGSHIVIYTVDENNDVMIVRVRHRHEDWIHDYS